MIKELRAAATEDTLMITDTGNHQTWVEQYWDVYGPRMVFTPGGFAGMGFGTYGVLGLKLARPDQPAVCVTSDGSFMMFPGAVATATETEEETERLRAELQSYRDRMLPATVEGE